MRRTSRPSATAVLSLVAFTVSAVVAGGCTRGPRPPQVTDGPDRFSSTSLTARSSAVVLLDAEPQRPIFLFDGVSGEPVDGRTLRLAMRQADVVILGETHDDAVAHQVKIRLVREAFGEGTSGALSLEMLERDDQPAARRLSARATGGAPAQAVRAAGDVLADTSLARWMRWDEFYLPAVQAALRQQRPVVAANAPGNLVTAARVRGFDFLTRLDEPQQRLVTLPPEGHDFGEYRERFDSVMRQLEAAHAGPHGTQGAAPDDDATRPTTRQAPAPRRTPAVPQLDPVPPAAEDEGNPATRPAREEVQVRAAEAHPSARPRFLLVQTVTQPATQPAVRPATRPQRDARSLDAFFDAQILRDATMADSVRRARRTHGAPVVHITGSFHSDFDGGLVQLLRRDRLRVMTISFVPAESGRLRPQDQGRADVVIYTGEPSVLPAD